MAEVKGVRSALSVGHRLRLSPDLNSAGVSCGSRTHPDSSYDSQGLTLTVDAP